MRLSPKVITRTLTWPAARHYSELCSKVRGYMSVACNECGMLTSVHSVRWPRSPTRLRIPRKRTELPSFCMTAQSLYLLQPMRYIIAGSSCDHAGVFAFGPHCFRLRKSKKKNNLAAERIAAVPGCTILSCSACRRYNLCRRQGRQYGTRKCGGQYATVDIKQSCLSGSLVY